jgi:estrogen-related receptor beta like 1
MYRDTPKIIIEDASASMSSFAPYIQMEDLLEKLKLLNYDSEFVQQLKMKYINR